MHFVALCSFTFLCKGLYQPELARGRLSSNRKRMLIPNSNCGGIEKFSTELRKTTRMELGFAQFPTRSLFQFRREFSIPSQLLLGINTMQPNHYYCGFYVLQFVRAAEYHFCENRGTFQDFHPKLLQINSNKARKKKFKE